MRKKSPEVNTEDLSHHMCIAMGIAEGIWKLMGSDLVITSGAEGYPGDGVHSKGSLHYPQNTPSGEGEAIDLRIWGVNADKAAYRLSVALGDRFDVVREKTHIHCEHDPE